MFAPGGSVAAGVLAATINWLLMANLMHDGCHAALSTRPWLNHVGHFLGSAPFGCGMGGWWLQHVISHHPNINQLELDYDAHHMPWTRWHKDVRPERHHNKAGVTQLVFHVVAHHRPLFVILRLCRLSRCSDMADGLGGAIGLFRLPPDVITPNYVLCPRPDRVGPADLPLALALCGAQHTIHTTIHE